MIHYEGLLLILNFPGTNMKTYLKFCLKFYSPDIWLQCRRRYLTGMIKSFAVSLTSISCFTCVTFFDDLINRIGWLCEVSYCLRNSRGLSTIYVSNPCKLMQISDPNYLLGGSLFTSQLLITAAYNADQHAGEPYGETYIRVIWEQNKARKEV